MEMFVSSLDPLSYDNERELDAGMECVIPLSPHNCNANIRQLTFCFESLIFQGTGCFGKRTKCTCTLGFKPGQRVGSGLDSPTWLTGVRSLACASFFFAYLSWTPVDSSSYPMTCAGMLGADIVTAYFDDAKGTAVVQDNFAVGDSLEADECQVSIRIRDALSV
jgi:hypothetical protein